MSERLRGLVRLGALLLVPGGALWALSPLGITLSEIKYQSPDVFWRLFTSAPLLLALGMAGLFLWKDGRGRAEKVGFAVALAGLVAVIVGNVGQFWLGLDEAFVRSAPFYTIFRVGLVVFAVGSAALVLAALAAGGLSPWGAAPLVAGAVGGVLAFSRDMGVVGASLWVLFGLSWAWMGLVLALEGGGKAVERFRGRRAGLGR